MTNGHVKLASSKECDKENPDKQKMNDEKFDEILNKSIEDFESIKHILKELLI
jgi:hypothetical protein